LSGKEKEEESTKDKSGLLAKFKRNKSVSHFKSVLQWSMKESLLNKKALSPQLLFLSYRFCDSDELRNDFLQLLFNVCSSVLTAPVKKLDWIWFNSYVISSAVEIMFCFVSENPSFIP